MPAGTRQLLAQAGIEVAPALPAGQVVGQPAAQHPGPVRGVLEADREHRAQALQEVAGKIGRKPLRLDGAETQQRQQPAARHQRHQRHAAERRAVPEQQVVVGPPVGPEPRPRQVRRQRRDADERIRELDVGEIADRLAEPDQQVTKLVARVLDHERDAAQRVGPRKAGGRLAQQFRQGFGAHQTQFAIKAALQYLLVGARCLQQLAVACLQLGEFAAQLGAVSGRPRRASRHGCCAPGALEVRPSR